MTEKKAEEDRDIVRFEHGSILADGYGLSPGRVMRDPKISCGAKGWYAYIMSYAGNGDRAWPGRDRQMKELAISKDTLTKYQREIFEAGLITIEQQRGTGGRFKRNIYTIQYIVDIPEAAPCPKITDTEKTALGDDETAPKPCPKFTVSDKLGAINNSSSLTNNRARSKNKITTDSASKTQPAIKRLIDFYFTEFERLKNEKPVIIGGRDGKIFETLLKSLSEESIQKLITRYLLNTKDKFIRENGWNLPTFEFRINQMILEQKEQKGISDLDQWVLSKTGGGITIDVNAGAS